MLTTFPSFRQSGAWGCSLGISSTPGPEAAQRQTANRSCARSAADHPRPSTSASIYGMHPMVRTISALVSNRIYQLSLAVGARSVVTGPSQSATTVLGVKEMKSALTMLYQNVVDLIGFRERVLLPQGRRPMEGLPQGAGVAVPQQSTRQAVSLTALRSSHVSPPYRRYSIPLKIRLSLSIHSKMTSAFIHWIPDSNSWKAWQGSVGPIPLIFRRCSRSTLQVPDTL
jgi:hypothetical protein